MRGFLQRIDGGDDEGGDRSAARVGPFCIVERIGAGGMGEVFKAHDSRLQRVVALKMLPAADRYESVARIRLLREARAAAALNHPHIATIYEVDDASEATYIAMEFVEGRTLRAVLDARPAAVEKLLDWGLQMGDALAAAHEAGVLHRDIKSLNTMVTPRDQIKILDFGLADWAPRRQAPHGPAPHDPDMTARLGPRGTVTGTVAYTAPEVLRGHEASVRSDIYSLGVVLYEIATGLPPFCGKTATTVMNAILGDAPAPLTEVVPGFPVELSRIIHRALAKRPEERYGTTRELLDDLHELHQRRQSERILESEEIPVAGAEIPGNLPAQVSSFIGREQELSELSAMLADHRLLTITGSGGAGKTRLSLELARREMASFPAGVFLVELAAEENGQDVASAVARGLGVREGARQELIDSVIADLRKKSVLLILDNCEHLVDACADLMARLLPACPRLMVLATSQERLDVPGEQTWQIPSLTLPEENAVSGAALEDLLEYGAVRLFAERAMNAQSGFVLSEANVAVVVQICRRLDGIALAIELAAARVRMLSVEQILDRLEDRFRLLTGGSRTSLPRQQTLLGAVKWSVDLLSPAEVALFARLSIFVDGTTLAAVEAVCSGDDYAEIDVLDLLGRLVDKSLVSVRNDGGARRYYLLDTMREYGAVKLRDSGDEEALRDQHARYFLRLAETAEPELTGPDQADWLDRLGREYGNLRAASETFVAADRAHCSLRLAAATWRFWQVRGLLTEGRKLLADGLADGPPDGPPDGPAAATTSREAQAGGGGTEAEGDRTICGATRNVDESKALRAKALCGAGLLANDQGDFTAAREHFTECLTIRRRHGDGRGTAEILKNLGIADRDQGDYLAARRLLEESLELNQSIRDRAGEAMCKHALGITAHRLGDCDEAWRLFEECLEIREQLGDPRGIAALLAHLGSVAFDQGDLSKAQSLLKQGLTMFRELDNKRGIIFALLYLGGVARQQGEFARARDQYTECLALAVKLGDKHHLARSLECFASLALAEEKTERALRIYGAADALRRAIGSPLTPQDERGVEGDLERACGIVGEARAAELHASAGAMSVEQAIELAVKRA